ncbi:MAG: transposase [Muribaculaceae bacterium]|nr:transposase [Muribaculaceae bacterium]
MDQEQFKNKKRWAGKAVPSMKRRRVGHDYSGRCIYMITLVVEGRRPLLGHVTGDGIDTPAEMHPSELGHAVLAELDNIHHHYPTIKILTRQVMPDHLHFILFVQEPISSHLSRVISGYKGGCNRHYRELYTLNPSSTLWEQGFNDRILEGKGHLQRMMDYIADNPRRLAIKQQHPKYFQVQRNVAAGDYTFAAMGNTFLLESPCRLQVQCTRSLTQEQIAATCRHFLEQARNGAVLVSPSISPGEKAVMRAAFEEGYPMIMLLENGFSQFAKPGGRYFDACAQGRLLLLAPWEHHNTQETIKRAQCLDLNKMAAAIATQR